MKKYIFDIIIGVLQFVVFYIYPIFAIKKDPIGMVMLMLAFTFVLSFILGIFSKKKINPMIGAAGISAFPMSGRIVHKMALEEDPQNFLLMHSIGVNVSGQIASVIAGGIILNLFS
jgi:oxaloacetate decarboxylase beta subunit